MNVNTNNLNPINAKRGKTDEKATQLLLIWKERKLGEIGILFCPDDTEEITLSKFHH